MTRPNAKFLTCAAALLVIGFSTVSATDFGDRDDGRAASAARYAGGDKFQYCGYCHGASGQGYYGYFPIPRLAGQQPEYTVSQLRAFIERRRDSHLSMRMSRVHGVGPALQNALAQRFFHSHVKPSASGPTAQRTLGKKIYEEGVPESNVPACGACHGLSGEGAGQNPRLAGQMYAYTRKNLQNWAIERGQDRSHPDASAIMLPIARNLTKLQISAVAAYVSSLP